MSGKFIFLSEGRLSSIGPNTYRKQVLKYGDFVDPRNPSSKMQFDKKFGDSLIRNFKNSVLDNVPVQILHTENPLSAVGNVIGLAHRGDGTGLDMICSITDSEAVAKIDMRDSNNQPIVRGVSLGLDLNYVDKESGKELGPIIRHAAIVTHGYIKGMAPFEPINLGDEENYISLIEDKENPVTDAEILAALKERGINLSDLNEIKTIITPVTAISTDLEGVIKKVLGQVNLADNDGISTAIKGLVAKVEETAKNNLLLADQIKGMNADKAISSLVQEGKVVPAEVDGLKKLYLSDSDLFGTITANRPVVVKLDQSKTKIDSSTKRPGEGVELSDEDVQREISRYAGMGVKSSK